MHTCRGDRGECYACTPFAHRPPSHAQSCAKPSNFFWIRFVPPKSTPCGPLRGPCDPPAAPMGTCNRGAHASHGSAPQRLPERPTVAVRGLSGGVVGREGGPEKRRERAGAYLRGTEARRGCRYTPAGIAARAHSRAGPTGPGGVKEENRRACRNRSDRVRAAWAAARGQRRRTRRRERRRRWRRR